MSTRHAIDHLVDRLVEDILDILQRAAQEHRDTALQTIASMLGGASPRTVAPRAATGRVAPAAPPAPARRAPAPSPRAAAVVAEAAKPAPSRPSRARVMPLDRPVSAPAAEPAPSSEERPSSAAAASERETTVLEAVRNLVRATASEVAERCNLPNGTTYVVLRALVAGRRVAKTETARGIEYSLVSTGGIQPFKRSKTASPATPEEGASSAPDAAPSPSETNDVLVA
jgi:hypothetical protein